MHGNCDALQLEGGRTSRQYFKYELALNAPAYQIATQMWSNFLTPVTEYRGLMRLLRNWLW